MAHLEHHAQFVGKPTKAGGWRAEQSFDFVNHQKVTKVVVKYKGDGPRPSLRIGLYASAKSASAEVRDDDELFLVMPVLEGVGVVQFFDASGYGFHDQDKARDEPFGVLRLVVEARFADGEGLAGEPPTFLVAVAGWAEGVVTHNATIFAK